MAPSCSAVLLKWAGVPAGRGAVRQKRLPVSPPTLLALLCISFLLISVLAPKAPASDQVSEPTAAEIEWLVRTAISEENDKLPSLLPLKSAELLKFRLVSRNRTSSTTWQAEIDLLFDFGPSPSSVLGYQRVRAGRFRLVIDHNDGRFELSRFSPVGRVHPLPAG